MGIRLHAVGYGYVTRSWTASTSAPRSSAAASPASAWRSASSRRARGLRRARARGRRRRHLAFQHLPRLRLRRAVAPLLVLVRAEPEWSETYSRQPEIRDYLRRVADELRRPPAHPPQQRRRRARVGRGRRAGRSRPPTGRSARASWSPAWARSPSRRSPTSRASTTSRARRSTPPAGTTTTTSRGKRVAAIGTGASAIQFVPEIQPQVEQLHVFQRTRAVDLPAPEPPDPRLGAAPLPPLPARCRSSCAAASTRGASCSCSASSRTRGS